MFKQYRFYDKNLDVLNLNLSSFGFKRNYACTILITYPLVFRRESEDKPTSIETTSKLVWFGKKHKQWRSKHNLSNNIKYPFETY